MEYTNLPNILSRYSFTEKMRVCQKYSRKTMTPTGYELNDELLSLPQPWDLETFFMLSIKKKEWNSNDFLDKNEKIFKKMMNCIHNYIHPKLELLINAEEFLDLFLIGSSATQFENQNFTIYSLYRYNYYFNFKNDIINMPSEFYKKFGCNYTEFLNLGHVLWLIFCTDSKVTIPTDFINYVLRTHFTAIEHLTITRQKYMDLLDEITDDISDYMYCLRPSYQYPFLHYDDMIYFPLPHLIIRSVTSSLLYRLTEMNNSLLKTIGKEVFETYLYDIIKNSGVFDEVYGEQKYKTKEGLENRSLDVLTRIGTNFILFDSKSTTPKIQTRIFDEKCIENNIETMAKHCIQMYDHMTSKFSFYSSVFKEHENIGRGEIWGVIVVREDLNVMRDSIYEKTIEYLGIEKNSEDYNWLRGHIGLVGLYDIERFCFTGSDILAAVMSNSKTGRYNDYWFSGTTESRIINDDLLEFKESLKKWGDSFLLGAKTKGYL